MLHECETLRLRAGLQHLDDRSAALGEVSIKLHFASDVFGAESITTRREEEGLVRFQSFGSN